jgi:anti-sigma B factor antagonist
MIVLRHHSEPPVPMWDPAWHVVALSGELDFASTAALGVLDEAVRRHPGAHVLVDLSDVTFLDSAALMAFAVARSRAVAGGGALSLHGASTFAQHLLHMWHLDTVWSAPTFPDDAA